MRSQSNWIAAILAVVAGVGAWELVRHLGGRREAWDDPIFWQLGYPIMLVAAFLLGIVGRDRPWRWAAAMMGAQAAWSLTAVLVRSGMSNLFPLGLLAFAVLGLPCALAAHAGKWVGDQFLT
jgi:hypothetical protein